MQQDKRYVNLFLYIFFSSNVTFFPLPRTVKLALSGHSTQYSIQGSKICFPYLDYNSIK